MGSRFGWLFLVCSRSLAGLAYPGSLTGLLVISGYLVRMCGREHSFPFYLRARWTLLHKSSFSLLCDVKWANFVTRSTSNWSTFITKGIVLLSATLVKLYPSQPRVEWLYEKNRTKKRA